MNFRADPEEQDGDVESVLKWLPKPGQGQSFTLTQWTRLRDNIALIDDYVVKAKRFINYEKKVFLGGKRYLSVSGKPYCTLQVIIVNIMVYITVESQDLPILLIRVLC